MKSQYFSCNIGIRVVSQNGMTEARMKMILKSLMNSNKPVLDSKGGTVDTFYPAFVEAIERKDVPPE